MWHFFVRQIVTDKKVVNSPRLNKYFLLSHELTQSFITQVRVLDFLDENCDGFEISRELGGRLYQVSMKFLGVVTGGV